MLHKINQALIQFNQRIGNVLQKLMPQNPRIKRLWAIVLFLAALHIYYSDIGVYFYIHDRPCSIHSSAQCQRASVAKNYYSISMNFFEPRIQRFAHDDGITGLEFPIIYYCGAIIYKIFGFNDMYLRLVGLVIVSAGLLFFYLLSLRLLKNALLAFVVVAASTMSPVLMYYTPSIMPDAPALAFVLMAWYFFFRYKDMGQRRDLVLFALFGTLGALIKVIAVLCFVVIICLLIIDRLKWFKTKEATYQFPNAKKILLAITLGIVTVLAWYMYSRWLTKAHNNPGFALSPMMALEREVIDKVFTLIKNVWRYQYYSYEGYVLMISALVFVLLTIRRSNRVLLAITVLYILGSACYGFLFLNQFMYHDYYLIAMMPTLFFLLLTFVDNLSRVSANYKYYITFAFLVIVFFNMKESLTNCEENYAYRYDNKVYLSGDFRPYYDLAPRLKAIGLTRKDKVLSAFDDSYSNTLYFMDQPGFTVESVFQNDTIQRELIAPDVSYLVVNDSAKFNKLYPNHFENKIVLVHRGLIVYKLK